MTTMHKTEAFKQKTDKHIGNAINYFVQQRMLFALSGFTLDCEKVKY
jgi:hypothetical protein